MPDTIRFKRGNLSSIGTLLEGEPYWSKDTDELYVGDAVSGNTLINGGGGSGITSINGDTTAAQVITSADLSVTIDVSTPGTIDLSVAAGGSGDVVGPASATDTAIALFDGTTGKLLKNSAVTVSVGGNVVTAGSVSGSAITGSTLHADKDSVATATAAELLTLTHNSTGTAAAGFGASESIYLSSSTTPDILAAAVETTWATATHASRKVRQVYSVYDTAAREALRLEASGSAAMLGVLGATAVIRQTGDAGSAMVAFGFMSGTPTFAAANLSGGTLAAGITASSLTSFGASPALAGTPTAPTAGGGTSTTQIATTAFVMAEVSAAVSGLLELKGGTDCSANPNYPAGSVGDTYYVTVAGKIGGASGKSVDVGDAYICKTDNAGGTEASVGTSWFVLEHNLAGALLSANNLSDLASAATARTNLGLGTAAVETWPVDGLAGGTYP